MLNKLNDLTGQVFGRLTVLERAENGKGGKARWRCLCICGNVTVTQRDRLLGGNTKSCGCLKRECAANLAKIDGRSKERLYNIWYKMKQRCNVPNAVNYANYGGRGIKVCEAWEKDYLAFRAWALENGYADNLSIDRIENDKGYCPENCRWISNKAQQRNRRNNRHIALDGETLTVAEWAERTGLTETTIRSRLRKGWSVERALTEPVKQK